MSSLACTFWIPAFAGMTIFACTSIQVKPYPLNTPIAQSGPQHILLGQKIDINSSDVTMLEALPGVGPALAQRIVDHRTANGPFPSVQALRTVSGIGEKTLQRLTPLLQISSKH